MKRAYIAYTETREWGSFTIKKSKRGFIVEGHSQIQGQLSGWRILLYYDYSYNEKTDLLQKIYNDPSLTIGHYLYETAKDWLKEWPKSERSEARVLRHGSKIV